MRSLAILALFGSACGASSQPAAGPKQPAVDEGKAEKDAKGLVQEIYETVQHASNTDSLMALLVDPLVVYGPRGTDSLGSRADVLVALQKMIDPKVNKKKPSVRSNQLVVVPSPGGHSAWAFDVVDIAGQSVAMTSILSNADDIWQVSAASLAAMPAMKIVRAELKKDAVVPPGTVGIAKVDPNAKGAVDKFSRGLTDAKVWGDDLGSRSDAVVIGPGTGDVTRGKSDIKKLFRKRGKSNVRSTAAGDVTAAATSDGELAWVTQPVVRFADDVDPLPLRVFAVYEKNGADWRMIALQESLAVEEPGTGAAYKKVVAPALPKVDPPPKPAEDAPPPKKKKKKKKSKPVDDE